MEITITLKDLKKHLKNVLKADSLKADYRFMPNYKFDSEEQKVLEAGREAENYLTEINFFDEEGCVVDTDNEEFKKAAKWFEKQM